MYGRREAPDHSVAPKCTRHRGVPVQEELSGVDPVLWDADWVLQRQQFFEWIDDEPHSSAEVASRLKADPGLQPLIEDAADGCSYLNAAGVLLFRAAGAVGPRAVWPRAAPLPPDDKNGLSGVSHHRPTGWEAFVERLCKVDCVSRVSFDGAASGGTAVKVLCASTGAIGVWWGPADRRLPLRMETTARGDAQTELVMDCIANTVL